MEKEIVRNLIDEAYGQQVNAETKAKEFCDIINHIDKIQKNKDTLMMNYEDNKIIFHIGKPNENYYNYIVDVFHYVAIFGNLKEFYEYLIKKVLVWYVAGGIFFKSYKIKD